MRLTNATVALLIVASAAFADNNVQWNGVSHIWWQDRRPLCPVNGESFDVLFQAYRFDIESARVRVNDGTVTWVDAAFDHDRGPYAVWRATIPATAATAEGYYIELTDGTDTDYLTVSGMQETSPNPPDDANWLLDFSTLEHAPIGATLVTGGAVFKFWGPQRTSTSVRGDFNGWSYLTDPLVKYGNYFIGYVSGAAYRDMYKYYYNYAPNPNPDYRWKPDARARSLNSGNNYNSHIEDPFNYVWGDGDFQTPDFNDMILYELHVGTFSGRNDPVGSGSIPGTYADVAAHVGHLVELGINVVELMPINEFPWDFSAGYNPVSCWAPEWKWGDPDDLKAMIDVLHQNGIAVLQDIIWNHFSGTDDYLWFYDGTAQTYFDNPAEQTPWGAQADFDTLEVRDYYADSSLYWLEEFHFDGFRMDGADYMNQAQGSGWGLMQRFNDEIDNRWIDKIAIAEQLPDDSWVTRPTSLGGAGFDAQWYDYFTDTLHFQTLQAGWDQANVDMWEVRNIINGGGLYLSNTSVVNYLELHDECWPSSGGERILNTIDPTAPADSIYAKGRTKMAQGIAMMAPGIPMILQGTEWLEDTNFGAGDAGGADRIDWSKKTTYAGIFQYYKDLIAVRKSNCACRADAGHQVFHVNNTHPGKVIAWQRYDGGGNILVIVANFSDNDYTGYNITLPQQGTWYEILNSQATVYEGNGVGNGGSVVAGVGGAASITIPQMGLLVLRHESPPGRSSDLEGGDGDTDLRDIAEFQRQYGQRGCGLSADLNEDGRVNLDDFTEMDTNLTGP